MKRQSSLEDNNNIEIPARVLDNLSLDENILFKFKGIKRPLNTKISKLFKYSIIVLSIVVIIEIIILILFIQDDIYFFLPFIALIPFVSGGYWLFLFKSKFFVSINYLALTNKAIYIYQHQRKVPKESETLERIELSSLSIVLVSELKTKENFIPRGLIDFVYPKESSSKSMIYPVNRKSIGEVNNVLVKYKIIESIIWAYIDVNERINIISQELNLRDLMISPTSLEFNRLKKQIRHHIVEFVIGGIVILICIILILLGDNIFSTIGIFGIVISFTLIAVIIRFDIYIRQVLPSNEGTMQITSEGLKFIHEKGTTVFNFDSNIAFDFKIIRSKMFSEKSIFIGTIIVQDLNNPHLKVKFGPTIEIVKTLELLFLSYLSWKNNHQLLFREEEISTLLDQKRTISSKGLIKSKVDSTLITEAITSQTIGLSEKQEESVKKRLIINEKVLMIYQPKRRRQVLFIHLIGIIIGIILTFFSIWRFFEPLLMPLFVMSFTIGITIIIFTLISLYNYIFIDRLYIFTNQKLIIKNFKKYFDVPYKDISLILLKEGRTSDIVQIDFKVDSEIKTNAKISNISLTIEKDSDLYDKIIYYKKTFT